MFFENYQEYPVIIQGDIVSVFADRGHYELDFNKVSTPGLLSTFIWKVIHGQYEVALPLDRLREVVECIMTDKRFNKRQECN